MPDDNGTLPGDPSTITFADYLEAKGYTEPTMLVKRVADTSSRAMFELGFAFSAWSTLGAGTPSSVDPEAERAKTIPSFDVPPRTSASRTTRSDVLNERSAARRPSRAPRTSRRRAPAGLRLRQPLRRKGERFIAPVRPHPT